MNQDRPSVTILYHFFFPDDVVSSRHFSDFAEELVKRDWDVTVLTSNRYCRYPKRKVLLKNENWRDIQIIRAMRPGWSQASNYLRIANSFWLIMSWTIKICKLPRTDVIIIGSDPQFSQFLFFTFRLLRRKSLLVYWCYDLYPEAIIADGAKGFTRWVAERLSFFIGKAYRFVDLVVDIGPCMRKRLDIYKHKTRCVTLTPWALVESESIDLPDPDIRYKLFGDTKLALLYSGNIGKAHDFSLFLELARKIYKRDPKVVFCFACRGNRYEELKKAIKPDDYNIRFAPFAVESELKKRLDAADIHLLSLRPEWEGIVVPSKFFGSLAVGKPVIYAGPKDSSIARWVREFNLGLVLTKENMEVIVSEILEIANKPKKLNIYQTNAHQVYCKHFSKTYIMNKWDSLLRELVKK